MSTIDELNRLLAEAKQRAENAENYKAQQAEYHQRQNRIKSYYRSNKRLSTMLNKAGISYNPLDNKTDLNISSLDDIYKLMQSLIKGDSSNVIEGWVSKHYLFKISNIIYLNYSRIRLSMINKDEGYTNNNKLNSELKWLKRHRQKLLKLANTAKEEGNNNKGITFIDRYYSLELMINDISKEYQKVINDGFRFKNRKIYEIKSMVDGSYATQAVIDALNGLFNDHGKPSGSAKRVGYKIGARYIRRYQKGMIITIKGGNRIGDYSRIDIEKYHKQELPYYLRD